MNDRHISLNTYQADWFLKLKLLRQVPVFPRYEDTLSLSIKTDIAKSKIDNIIRNMTTPEILLAEEKMGQFRETCLFFPSSKAKLQSIEYCIDMVNKTSRPHEDEDDDEREKE